MTFAFVGARFAAVVRFDAGAGVGARVDRREGAARQRRRRGATASGEDMHPLLGIGAVLCGRRHMRHRLDGRGRRLPGVRHRAQQVEANVFNRLCARFVMRCGTKPFHCPCASIN